MLRRYELTDSEWNRIVELLPLENTGKQGCPRKDNRTILGCCLAVGLFAIFIHPYTFYCSSFILNTSIQFLFIAIIIHMLALAIIRMPDYNYTDMICRKDLGVMEYMSCPEAAKKWGISERRVQILCRENRIPGVSKLGYMWLIPKDAEKPIDGRTKQGKELHHE